MTAHQRANAPPYSCWQRNADAALLLQSVRCADQACAGACPYAGQARTKLSCLQEYGLSTKWCKQVSATYGKPRLADASRKP